MTRRWDKLRSEVVLASDLSSLSFSPFLLSLSLPSPLPLLFAKIRLNYLPYATFVVLIVSFLTSRYKQALMSGFNEGLVSNEVFNEDGDATTADNTPLDSEFEPSLFPSDGEERAATDVSRRRTRSFSGPESSQNSDLTSSSSSELRRMRSISSSESPSAAPLRRRPVLNRQVSLLLSTEVNNRVIGENVFTGPYAEVRSKLDYSYHLSSYTPERQELQDTIIDR